MNRARTLSRLSPGAAFDRSKGSASRAAEEDESRASSLKLRQLIVNADDFGMSEEVNEAIIRAHKEGVLTSASLMVTGDAFEQAARLAKENPKLAVGIHLVTVVGRSVLPKSEIPSLVDDELMLIHKEVWSTAFRQYSKLWVHLLDCVATNSLRLARSCKNSFASL